MDAQSIATLALAAIGAVHALFLIGQRLAEWLRARAEGEASTAKKALRLAEKTREDTGAHVARWSDCEARCRELTGSLSRLEAKLEEALEDNRELKQRLEQSEARARQYLDRIRVLEESVKTLQARVGIYRSLDNIRRLKPAEEA